MKGNYTLLIEINEARNIAIGKRCNYHFDSGHYAYVGSALNSLEKRIKRHFRTEKKLHWHIDYLLKHAKVRRVICAETDKKLECLIAKEFLKILECKSGFGCSDCKCEAHLFYHNDLETLREIVLNGFRVLDLIPVEISDSQSASKALSSRSSNEGSIS